MDDVKLKRLLELSRKITEYIGYLSNIDWALEQIDVRRMQVRIQERNLAGGWIDFEDEEAQIPFPEPLLQGFRAFYAKALADAEELFRVL